MTNNQGVVLCPTNSNCPRETLLSYALKEALLREDQRLARTSTLPITLRDRRLKQLFENLPLPQLSV